MVIDLKNLKSAIFNSQDVSKIILNNSTIWEKSSEDVETESITYGVRLDKAILTGTEWGSYTDDAVGLNGAYMDFTNDVFVDNGWKDRFPFNQIKPCLLKNGVVVGYLNPNDYTLFEDGTSSNITSEDSGYLMVEIPKIYYSITRDDNYIDVKISNTAKEGFVCNSHVYKGKELDKLYISAYLCGNQNFDAKGFKTASGTQNQTSVTLGYNAQRYNLLKTYDGERFEFLPYNVLKLIQCLYIIMFKNTDSQASLGAGYSAERTTHTVGLLDQKGMYYGANTSQGVKFIGLEDIYGARTQLVTGFYIEAVDSSTFKPRYINVYDENMSYSPDEVLSYLTSTLPFTKGSKYLRAVTDINEDAINIGFWAGTISTDKTLGFCDSSSQTTNNTSFVDFGWTGTGQANGIFAQKTTVPNDALAKRSARLVYYPEA